MFYPHNKNWVPMAWATHDRVRLIETLSLLLEEKHVGRALDMSNWCPETVFRGIKPRAPLDQLHPAFLVFKK